MPVPTGAAGDGSDDLRIGKTGRANESVILSCGVGGVKISLTEAAHVKQRMEKVQAIHRLLVT